MKRIRLKMMLPVFMVMALLMGGCVGDGKPNWGAACQQLRALDRSAESFQLNHPPDSKVAKAIGEWRAHAAGTIDATCAISKNPNAKDPTPLVWSSIDLGKDMIRKYVDEEKQQKWLTVVAAAESALILFNVPPRQIE